MKNDKYPVQGKYSEEKYRRLRKQWGKIEKFFRKDYPAVLLGVLFTAAITFSILSYKQHKGKETFSVSKSNILGEKAGSISATSTISARIDEFSLISSVSSTKPATKPNSVPSKSGFLININTADIATLSYLPGIKVGLATRIIEFRKANGFFKSTTQLIAVKGIGPKTFEKIKDLVTVGE